MPSSFEIRRLTETDAEALWNLRLTALETEPSAFAESAEEHRQTTLEAYAARLRAGGSDNFVLGVFVETQLVGMAGFYREQRQKRRHLGGIWGVFVLAPYRGRGLARALIAAIVGKARALDGIVQIHLSVSMGQQSARGLYAAMGFRTFGIEPQGLKISDTEYADQEQMSLAIAEFESNPAG